MAVSSKIFRYPYRNFHCSQLIVHPGIGCTQFFLHNFIDHYKGALKYFTPLLISPLIMKYKTMNRELFVNIVKNYIQTVNWGSLSVTITFFFVCFLRHIFGSFNYYTTSFVPTLIGMQTCWFYPKRVLSLFTISTAQGMIEVLMRQYPNCFSHLILHSPIVQTLLFMLNSAIILHYKRKNVYKSFWFIQPYETLNIKQEHQQQNNEIVLEENQSIEKLFQEKLLNEESYSMIVYSEYNKTKCSHKHLTCKKFILNGIKSYLIFGIPLDVLPMLIGGKVSKGSQSLMSKILGKLKTFRPKMTGFFITYVGLYRLSSCLLGKYYKHLAVDVQHLVAAFLGGLSFLFVKRVNFLTLSMVLSIQILWQQFCEYSDSRETVKKPNIVLQLLRNVPFSQLLFIFNCSYLVHTSIVDYPTISSVCRAFLDGLTCNKTRSIYYSMADFNPQTMIFGQIYKPLKTFL